MSRRENGVVEGYRGSLGERGRKTGEERAGSGIPNVVGTGRK